MDTNDDRSIDLHEFITVFARRHIDGGWLKTEDDPHSEVLVLEDDIVESVESRSSSLDKPTKKKGGKKTTQGKKVKGKKKR